GVVWRNVDPVSGGLATAACPGTRREPFLAGTEPQVPCPLHRPVWTALGDGVGGAMRESGHAIESTGRRVRDWLGGRFGGETGTARRVPHDGRRSETGRSRRPSWITLLVSRAVPRLALVVALAAIVGPACSLVRHDRSPPAPVAVDLNHASRRTLE